MMLFGVEEVARFWPSESSVLFTAFPVTCRDLQQLFIFHATRRFKSVYSK